VFLLACAAVATARGKSSTGDTIPFVRLVWLFALRRTRFLGVAIAFLWELPIRESR
jgi:hypothetical protein